jgi:YebC/PmpR family DNA-binding regulatory protein
MGRAYEVRKASIAKTGAAKAKLYSNFAKEIYIVAKKGVPDPDSNIDLKHLIDKAKKQQVPSDIINRAVDKAKGAGGEDYEVITYEGFGPGASTLIIKTMTDNVNRTVGFVRAAFNKVNKSLGVTNSVSYNYDHLGMLGLKTDKGEELFEKLLDAGINIVDFEDEDGYVLMSVAPSEFNTLKSEVEKIIPNPDYDVDEIGMYAKNKVTLEGEDLELFKRLYNLLDEIEDVTDIYHNVNL